MSKPRAQRTQGRPARPPSKKRRKRRRNRRLVLPAMLVGALGIGILATVATRSPAPAARPSPAPTLGAATAKVVLAEYGDFQCSACGAFSRQVGPTLRQRYIDTGLVRMEWHDFAWKGPESVAAANAARCAGDQDRFWEYHDALYENQAGENSGAFRASRLKSFAARLGLDRAAFDACVDGQTHYGAVRADQNLSRDLALTGTPSFFVNGQQIAASPSQLFAAIDAALAA